MCYNLMLHDKNYFICQLQLYLPPRTVSRAIPRTGLGRGNIGSERARGGGLQGHGNRMREWVRDRDQDH